jgi:NADPH-dependent glutamate synthase beta subunit-like oxidoreductase
VLVRSGVSVTVYDRHPEIGGLLTFGIPAFKLDNRLLARRRDIYRDGDPLRAELRGGPGRVDVAAKRAITTPCLLAWHLPLDEAGIPHEDAPGVYDALPFLVGTRAT